ncbi:hypothetical protein ACIF9R_32265 [Streptomyces sp. NPDC086080]
MRRSAAPGLTQAPPTEFAEFRTTWGRSAMTSFTKRHWGAFTGTELDL